MSQENVEIVRPYLEGTGAPLEDVLGPAEARERFMGWWAGFWESDGDYHPVRGFPDARPRHGREEIIDFLAEYLAAYERYRYMVEEARAIGDDRVFAHGQVWADGRASRAAAEGDLYHCFWLRHGRFIRVEDHLAARGALHAVGLGGVALKAAGLRGSARRSPLLQGGPDGDARPAMSQESVELARRRAASPRSGLAARSCARVRLADVCADDPGSDGRLGGADVLAGDAPPLAVRRGSRVRYCDGLPARQATPERLLVEGAPNRGTDVLARINRVPVMCLIS
jgi:hypothetical protein